MKEGLLAVLVLIYGILFGQDPEGDLFRGITEGDQVAVTQEQEALQLRLDAFRKRPMDLNRASAEEMAELGLLSPLQIESWIRFRKNFGPAESWYVFQSVPGWGVAVVSLIKPFCRLGVFSERGSGLIGGALHQLILGRVSWQGSADLPNQVEGVNLQRLFRYRLQTDGGVSAGLTMESDAGESVVKRGPDFISGFVERKQENGKWRGLVGDFSVQLGQGLICWQGMTFGAGSDVTAVKRQGLTVRSYQSIGEGRFMRGLAGGGNRGAWSWDVFLSRHAQTASVYSLTGGRQGFRQVDESGNHRTLAEINRKDAVLERTIGFRLSRALGIGRINLNTIGRDWSVPRFELRSILSSDTFWMRRLWNISVDFSLTRGPLHAFGEMAMDAFGHRACLMGAVMVLDKKIDLSIHGRRIGVGFRSVEGQAFQQSSSGRPESGFYAQLHWRPHEQHTIDAFADYYHFPTAGYRIYAPSVGISQGFRWIYQPDKRNRIQIRIQSARNEREVGVAAMPRIVEQHFLSVRFHCEFSVGADAKLSWRAERVLWSANKEKRETGFLAYVEWSQRVGGSSVRLDLRGMWVATDGWDSRIYAYERDVLYKVAFPAFSGNRLRGYLNLSIPLGRSNMVWFRVSSEKKY